MKKRICLALLTACLVLLLPSLVQAKEYLLCPVCGVMPARVEYTYLDRTYHSYQLLDDNHDLRKHGDDLKEEHVFQWLGTDPASCIAPVCEKYECSICEYHSRQSIGERLPHVFGEWECNGDKTHTRRCLDEYNVKCTYSETANCQIRAATCTEKSVCSDCGAVYGDELEHDFTGIYRLAQSGHQRKCTRCDEWSAVESHTVGTAATCTEATICGVCDLPYGDELGHDFSGAYRLAQGGHQRKCTRCDEWSAVESHTVGTAATCTAKAICGICDLPYGDELGHDFSGAYVAAQDGHRRECARCPELDGVEEHVPGSAATCGSEQICAVCGWVMGDSLIHWYGDWTPADNETHSAKCIRHGCAWEKTVACAKASVEFDGHDISLCAVCGGVSEGDTLAVLPEASAATQPGNQPRGEMIARVGTLGGETIVSLCFEIGGVLLTPEGEMLVTLPTDALKGDRLFALGADGEWVELTFQIQTIDGKDMLTFTIDFGLDSPSGAPVLILRAA